MENKQSVEEYLATLNDEQTAKDSQVLIDMMQRVSGHEPELYNASTSDIERPVLEQIVRQSNVFITTKAQDGPIDKILWKTETA